MNISEDVQAGEAITDDAEKPKKKGKKNPEDRGLFERPKGSGNWGFVYFYKGQKKREMAGPKSLARKARRKRLTQIAEGRFFPEKLHQKETLLSDMIDDVICRAEGRIIAMSDYKRYGKYWKEVFPGRTLQQISTGDIERYQAQRRKSVAPATVNREVKFLKRVFNVAKKDKLVTENPTDGVTLDKENNELVRWLTDEEEARLKDSMRPEHWPLVSFAIRTGLRQGEQFKLRWENVNFSTGLITVPRSKSGKLRRIEMNDTVCEILRNLPSRGRSPYVFPSATGETCLDARNFVHRSFWPAVKIAKLEKKLRWHDLRHTFASRLAMANIDLLTIKELMGHQSVKMTERYAHLSAKHRHSAVQCLNERSCDTKTDTSETRAEAAV